MKPHRKAQIKPGVTPGMPIKQRVAHPMRQQRQRTKGWQAPSGAVYCGRPSRWGNPVTSPWANPNAAQRMLILAEYEKHFRDWLDKEPGAKAELLELKGKVLLCWCPLHKQCHVDVMLRIIDELSKAEA